jgi:hypothetical protein
MDGSGWGEAQAGRDRGGRFAAGVSGNPVGKRKGTLNRATMLAAALSIDESGTVARVVIDRALAGDVVTARFCLRLLQPKPRDRPVEVDLPAVDGLDDIVACFAATVAAMASGEITPQEALTVSKVLNQQRRAIEARERQQTRAARRGRNATQPGADLHPACNFTPNEESAEPAEAETPPAAPAPDPVAADLHLACNFSSRGSEVSAAATALDLSNAPGAGRRRPADASGFTETAIRASETLAEPGETAEATDAPQRPPLPGFGSACIRPAIRRRISRFAA